MVGMDNVVGAEEGFGAEDFVIFCGVFDNGDVAGSVSDEEIFRYGDGNFAENSEGFFGGFAVFGDVANHVIR